jgi:pyruvate dehydrogenase complex dehydrogenase (E1) component
MSPETSAASIASSPAPRARAAARTIQQHRNRGALAITADQHALSLVGRAETDPGEITGAMPGAVTAT